MAERTNTEQTFELRGAMTRKADGSFIMTLEGIAQGGPPDPPDPEEPDIPEGAIIVEPGGGDDVQRLRDAWATVPDGGTLVLKGMFDVGQSMFLTPGRTKGQVIDTQNADGKTVMGDPSVQSGFRITNPDMSGDYGAMLVFRGCSNCTVRGLEIDAQGHSALPIEVNGGSDNCVEDCYIHDVGCIGGNDPTNAGIHSESGTRLTVRHNRIERTGNSGDSGVRGIWLSKGQVDCLVEDNEVSDTGHTGIAVEPASGVIRRNTVFNATVDGTGYKIAKHPNAPYAGRVEFYENYVNRTIGGGIMLEAALFEEIDLHHNRFVDCGQQGTTFGAIYASSSQGSHNIRFHDNLIENCRSQGALLHTSNSKFENNTITGPNTLALEQNCHGIELVNSGKVEVGPGCSQIYQDGVQVA
jgi:parallel beta-helix repeat protein